MRILVALLILSATVAGCLETADSIPPGTQQPGDSDNNVEPPIANNTTKDNSTIPPTTPPPFDVQDVSLDNPCPIELLPAYLATNDYYTLEQLVELHAMTPYKCLTPSHFTVPHTEFNFGPITEDTWLRPSVNIGGCTSNGVFAEYEDGAFVRFLIGTAQHCISDGGGDGGECRGEAMNPEDTEYRVDMRDERTTWAYSISPIGDAADLDLDVWERACEYLDFGLHVIPPELEANLHPAFIEILGPTGLADPLEIPYGGLVINKGSSGDREAAYNLATDGDPPENDLVSELGIHRCRFEGNWFSNAFDWGTDCRATGIVSGSTDVQPTLIPITGDSGSGGLTEDGRLWGANSRLNPFPIRDDPPSGTSAITTLSASIYDSLLFMRLHEGLDIRLVTYDQWTPDFLHDFGS